MGEGGMMGSCKWWIGKARLGRDLGAYAKRKGARRLLRASFLSALIVCARRRPHPADVHPLNQVRSSR